MTNVTNRFFDVQLFDQQGWRLVPSAPLPFRMGRRTKCSVRLTAAGRELPFGGDHWQEALHLRKHGLLAAISVTKSRVHATNAL
jgi:hypothetical protein